MLWSQQKALKILDLLAVTNCYGSGCPAKKGIYLKIIQTALLVVASFLIAGFFKFATSPVELTDTPPNFTFNATGPPASQKDHFGGTDSSKISGSFNVTVLARSDNVILGDMRSETPIFTFRVVNGVGNDITKTLVLNSSGFVVPPHMFFRIGSIPYHFELLAGQEGIIRDFFFSFSSRDHRPLVQGPYFVEVSGITYSLDGGRTYFYDSTQGKTVWPRLRRLP